MQFQNQPPWLVFLVIALKGAMGADDDYNVIHRDGSYEFGYNNPDSYHYADANRNNVVKGEFGGRNPATGAIDSTVYTAGPRGFRPRGKNVVRKYDLNQNGPRPIGSRDDPYYDPYEDPSYSFSFRTRTYNRQENSNRVGDVNGRYSYVDDIGERHNVEFIAGKNTGFHVKTPFPDSNPRAYGPLYFNGRGKPIPRGRTSIQRGLDGSYRFVSAGPDQRRTETSDSTGHVRGSYTYLDDKGVQHSVHYIAGPETGYRVLKHVKGPHLPTVFPFGRPEIIPPDFYDDGKDGDVFDTAASGHIKPIAGKPGAKEEAPDFGKGDDANKDDFTFGMKKPQSKPSKPSRPFAGVGGGTVGKPSYTDDDTDDFGDLFGEGSTGGSYRPGGVGATGGSSVTGTTSRPTLTSGQEPQKPGLSSGEDDGSYKPSAEEGAYKPTFTKPTPSYGTTSTSRPGQFDIGSTSSPQGPSRPIYGEKPGVRPGGVRPGGGPGGRPGGLPGGRPGGLPGGRPGGLPGGRPGGLPGGRPGGLPGGRPGGQPGGLAGGLPGGTPTTPPVSGVGYGDGFGAGRPSPDFSEEPSKEVNDDFGLFGSESNNARPPYGGGAVIHVGGTDASCQRCKGTIVTNVGDRLFTVPPGVSVRAHVQAIDILPIIPTVPSPSEQYKADTSLRTEQLNEATNNLVSTNYTESAEETTTDATITTTLIPSTDSPDT